MSVHVSACVCASLRRYGCVCVSVGFNSLNSNYALLLEPPARWELALRERETPIPRNGKLNWPPGHLSEERCSYYRATYVRKNTREYRRRRDKCLMSRGIFAMFRYALQIRYRLLIKFRRSFLLLETKMCASVNFLKEKRQSECNGNKPMSNWPSFERTRRIFVEQFHANFRARRTVSLTANSRGSGRVGDERFSGPGANFFLRPRRPARPLAHSPRRYLHREVKWRVRSSSALSYLSLTTRNVDRVRTRRCLTAPPPPPPPSGFNSLNPRSRFNCVS